MLVFGGAFVYVALVPLPPDRALVQTTFLYASGGERIAALSNGQNREVVRLRDVPKVVVDAVLAAEDRRFYEHRGVDPLGIARALYRDVRGSGGRQGGSTITQQYVKNVYVGREVSLRRKLREAAIAIKLERRLSKEAILERYLNAIYFGRGAYGIQAAARAHFGRDVASLDLAQAAYLAALIRSPENTDASRFPERARTRRASVLDGMVKTGAITTAQRDAASAEALTGGTGVIDRNVVVGTIYDHPEAGAEFFIDAVRRSLVQRYGEDAVLRRGLRVTTTLDLAAQTRAYRSAFGRVLAKPGDPDAAVVVLDHDGHTRAMVGGRNWSVSKVNLAMGRDGGGVGRGAGSTFKPFVLAAVVDSGYSLTSALPSPATITIDGADVGATPWRVRNFDSRSHGVVSLVEATRQSLNTVFAQIVTSPAIGPARVADMARRLGVRSALQPVNAIALGAENVAPLEMADAYLTFANRGERVEPTFVESVTDASGARLRSPNAPRTRVVSEKVADQVASVLRRVVSDGTGRGARLGAVPVAGKTGTTSDYNDAWFIGFTPRRCCVVAVWMGYADGTRRMTSVHGGPVTGASLPATLFAEVLGPMVKGVDVGRFINVATYRGALLPGATRGSVDISQTRLARPTLSGPGAGSTARVPVAQPDASVVSDSTARSPGPTGAPDAPAVPETGIPGVPTVAPVGVGAPPQTGVR